MKEAQPQKDHFFPLFLMPCAPVFRGPLLAFALAASSALAFASVLDRILAGCLLLKRSFLNNGVSNR